MSPVKSLAGRFWVLGILLSAGSFASSDVYAQTWWWDSVRDGIPDPSIATSLPRHGDPAGLRKWAADHGVVYGLEYTNDVLANVRGGLRTGAIDQGKLHGILTVDLGKL